MTLQGTHDPILVAASYLVAVMASYALIELSVHVAASRAAERRLWIGLGSLTLGLGIWGTQFLGLLAFRLPVPTAYDPTGVALSILPAVACIAVAFWALGRQRASFSTCLAAGALISLAKGVMHYLGLEAMITVGTVSIRPWFFGGALVVTAVVAAVLLAVLFRRRMRRRQRLLAATLIGAVVFAHHYVGMQAVTVSLPSGFVVSPLVRTGSNGWLAAGIVLVVALATLSTLFFSILIRRGRTRLVQLIAVQGVVALGVVAVSFALLIGAEVSSRRHQLLDVVENARAMLAVAGSTHRGAGEGIGVVNAQARETMLETLVRDRFGTTGEVLVARREGSRFVFPYSERQPVAPRASQLADLIQRAFAGEAGTDTVFDPRGGQVLVAYGRSLDGGVAFVAKIDGAEIREPFLRAGVAAGLVSFVLVLLGTFVLVRIGNPLIVQADAGAYLRAVIDSAPLPMMVEAADGTVLQINRGWDRYLGFSSAELVGGPRDRVLQEKTAAAIERLCQRARQHGQAVAEIEMPTAVGETHFRVAVSVAEGFAEGSVIWIAEDLTERRQAEERLDRSERRFRTIFESAPVAIFVEDFSAVVRELDRLRAKGVTDLRAYAEGHPGFADRAIRLVEITDFNLAAARMHGAATKQGLREAIGTLYTDRGREIFVEELMALFAGEPRFEAETSFCRIDGTTGHAVLTMRLPRPGEDGEGVLVSLLDVTAQVTSRRALEEARRAAEEMAAAKSQFLANMSHEIRTPMNGVMGMLGLLLDGELSEQQRELSATAYSSAESLLGILNDVLDVSKIEAGRMEIESIPFDPGAELNSAARVLAARAAERGNDLEVELGGGVPPRVLGDPGRLRQVVTNLLSNAIKFTENGEVVLTLSGEAAGPDATRLRVAVHDTGVGIDPEKLDAIFKEFSQADPSITRTYGGTGLGLTISRRLVELMGSRLEVRSEPGRGSEFFFELVCPRAEAEGARIPSEAATPTAGAGRRLRILLAEDNRVNRRIAVSLLEKMGHAVDLAENGCEAVDKVDQERYDLVLMDIQMPLMDGLEATRRIRAAENGRRLPIVAITAHALTEERERCDEAGMDGFLTKPFKPEQLRHAIDRAVA